MIKVCMNPDVDSFNGEESGIRRVVEAYRRYLPAHDITFVDGTQSRDVYMVHAGADFRPDVLICHGLYWTADYAAPKWEWAVNRYVIEAARYAKQITVPSTWVQEVFARDMRVLPTVVPHGINVKEWDHNSPSMGFVLWNKNRTGVDVCNTNDLERLARAAPDVQFLSTFANDGAPSNVQVTGLLPHARMKRTVQEAGVYLSTVKETFGIGVLEAMAAGVPVLGWKRGGNVDLVQHGVNGFLAEYGDWNGLLEGLHYCLRYRETLGANGRELARRFTWEAAAETVAQVITRAYSEERSSSVSVIIPCYNYGDRVERAIASVEKQTLKAAEIIVVDDGSMEEHARLTRYVCDRHHVTYIRKENGGVATARNLGIQLAKSDYVCCLDADDAIAPTFLEVCMRALVADRSLAIAYTGLHYIRPDGREGDSEWPGDYDYDLFLKRQNQVPTCCVFKRVMWERLGGYNQRYAPGGAGAEDAEFFLRAGAYGFGAQKVTGAGLFLYSWGSGIVSGNKEYREVDWTSMHPWTSDGQHPFASQATPKNIISHAVRQYDEPEISVIIPVGPGHTHSLLGALDSLESQTFRKWEVIVAWDDPQRDAAEHARILTAYPYIRSTQPKTHGAGAARNAGAALARAALLLFLDADDSLYPDALQRMIDVWRQNGGIIYTDYVGKAYIDRAMAMDQQRQGRLLQYDEKSGEAVMRHYAGEYDCARAQRQPDPSDMYIWNLITSLVPKSYHLALGGFDEQMDSWEDWDYWLRMAQRSYCFHHISEPLVVYRFYTGNRRETGLQQYPHLIQYLQAKYGGIEKMACTGCGGNVASDPNPSKLVDVVERQVSAMDDQDYVLVFYDHPNRGQHRVVGDVTHTFYGYRGGGEQFYAHRLDIAARPDVFRPIVEVQDAVLETQIPAAPASLGVQPSGTHTTVVEAPVPIPPAPTEPPSPSGPTEEPVTPIEPAQAPADSSSASNDSDLQRVAGISDTVARELNAAGIYTITQLRAMSEEALVQIKGIGRTRAALIIEFLQRPEHDL